MPQKTYMYDTQWTALLNAIGTGDSSAIVTALNTIKNSLDNIINAISSQSITVDFSNINSDNVSNLSNVTGGNITNAFNNLNSTLNSKQDVLLKGVPSDTSFDTIIVPGIYWINPGVTTGNHPMPEDYGVLEVLVTGVGVIQQNFYLYNGSGVSPATRQYTNNTWTSWQNKVRLITNRNGGELQIWGPNNNTWYIDSYNSDILRFYTFNNGVYKAGHINANGDLVSETGDVFNSEGTSLQELKNRIDSLTK